jgi:excisionase family DNA binding protein
LGAGRFDKEWLTIQEAADYLGVSYGRLSTLVKKGVYPVSFVPGFKGLQRISRSRLDQMMQESEHKNGEKANED